MKRLHVHISVDDLDKSIGFYSTLFGEKPTKQKQDYAKWQLEDPYVNFAISNRNVNKGIEHLGIQVENESELEELRERLKQADMQTLKEGETTCCYAKSDKTWVEDPSGIAWESYRTMGDVEFFNSPDSEQETSACCTPKASNQNAQSGCCG